MPTSEWATMAYTANSDSFATAPSNYYRSRLLSPPLPPADTATLREIIETPEGSLMHYSRRPTRLASREMEHQRPREGWLRHCHGIWETEACILLPVS